MSDQDHVWARAKVMVYPTEPVTDNTAYLVTAFEHNYYSYKYKTLEFNTLGLTPNQWNKVEFEYLSPEIRNPSDPLKVYVVNQGPTDIYIDDLSVEVFERR